jgi:hypothetical protein
MQIAADAIYATLRMSVLPVSQCVYKLGGQRAIAQRFCNPIFGTTVPSGHGNAEKSVPRGG